MTVSLEESVVEVSMLLLRMSLVLGLNKTVDWILQSGEHADGVTAEHCSSECTDFVVIELTIGFSDNIGLDLPPQ